VSVGRLWQVLRQMGLRLKKVAPRHRTRPRREPQAAGRVPPAPPDHPAGEVDLPRRERSDHANDTRLCPRQRRAARA
jgi:hypothetical protein